MREIKQIECPYCNSKKVYYFTDCGSIVNYDIFECSECGRIFEREDVEREFFRHQISPLLNGTSEERPQEIFFMLPSAEEEACGLSSLEIPHIDKIFELECDGTMWYHIDGEYETDNSGKVCPDRLLWHDFDELETDDMRKLLEYLRAEI